MTRLILFLLAVAALATGLSWLADRPGSLIVNWEGYELETSVFRAVVIFSIMFALALALWSLLRNIWYGPAALGHFLTRRRQQRGLDALSSGMIAIGAGDRANATRYAIQARRSLPNEPMTHLLRAQAAQLSGDKPTARRIFEAMLGSPDTEQLGLRGLFLEAQREGEREAAQQFAERAIRLNPRLSWPVDALFELQCRASDWDGALKTLTVARKHGQIEKPLADRRRAVLMTAQAQAAEDSDPEKALTLALEAHGLAPDLIPAAAIAGRMLASRGNTPRAAKIIQKTWLKSPHPDLANAYAFARLGDSTHDRLTRVKQLASLCPYSIESPIAVARAAIDARDFGEARAALEPLLDGRLTQRVATLMARIEGEQHGDKGRVREWLARAVNAPRDPAWTADGVISEQWQPISPVTGALDAFQWRVPVESLQSGEGDMLAQKLEELVALGAAVVAPPAPPAQVVRTADAIDLDAEPVTAEPPADKRPKNETKSEAARPQEVDGAQAEAKRVRHADDEPPVQVKPVAATATATTATAKPKHNAEPVAGAGAADARAGTSTRAVMPEPGTAKASQPDRGAARSVHRPASPPIPRAKAETREQTESRVFVAPRAPDDPGPEASDTEEFPSPLGAVRATS